MKRISLTALFLLLLRVCVFAQPTVTTAFKSLQIGNPYPGAGNLGNGTINASGGYYVNGTLITGGSGGQVVPVPAPPACTLYASTTGSGTVCSSGSPCALAYAASILAAGNVLCLNDGTYNYTTGSATLTIPASGTQAAPITVRPTNFTTVISPTSSITEPTVIISASGGTNTHGVFMNGQQWVNIYGLEVDGTLGTTDGFGIIASNAGNAHIGFYGNYVHNWAAGGIACNNGDYCTIQGNVVFSNAATNNSCDSNISIYEPIASDGSLGYHMIVTGNISHDALQPASGCFDGEGVIFDDWDHTQSDNVPYIYNGLITNNVFYNNAGEGVQVYQHNHGIVDIQNNSLYHNATTVAPNGSQQPQGTRGEIVIQNSSGVRPVNNIMWISPTGNGGLDTGMTSNNSCSAIIPWLGNMVNTDTGMQNATWSTCTAPGGNPCASATYVNYCNVNPLWVSPSTANFRLQTISPTIGIGIGTYGQPVTDILGFIRSASITLGAYVLPGSGSSGGITCMGCSVADIPLWTGATLSNSALSDNGTTVNSTEPITVPNATITNLSPNRCVQTGSGGALTTAASLCNTSGNNWCNGSSAPVNYSGLPSSPATLCEQWVTQVPGGTCRAHYPPSYVYGSAGSQATVGQTTMSVAIAPFTSGSPTVVASTLALGPNQITVPSHTDGAGNLLMWFITNYNAYPSTPSGWNLAGQATNAGGGGPIYLSAFTRIPSTEPTSYPQPTGAVFNADVMYSLSNAANSTTPDALTTRNDASAQTGLTAPAMSGLSTSTDMSFNIFAWGSFSSPVSVVAQGSIVVDQNTPYNNGSGGSQGLMTSHLALAANTAATQFAVTPSFGTQTCKLFYDGSEYVEEGY